MSNKLKKPPKILIDKVEIYSGSIPDLLKKLENKGYKHAYIDGGATITSFINLKLINEMTITRIPALLGEGIPLFGSITQNMKTFKQPYFQYDFIQVNYSVNYQ